MRRILSAALVGVATAALVLAAAAPASAHNYVVSSTPADGEVLTELPEAWEVVTNDTLLYAGNDSVFGLWVRDADGLFYGDGCVAVEGAGMTADPVIGAPGDYTLVYSLISTDGHPLTGEIPFEWAGEAEVATGAAEAPRCGAVEPESGGEAVAPSSDVVWIVAALAAVGVAVVVTVLLARRPKRRDDDSATT